LTEREEMEIDVKKLRARRMLVAVSAVVCLTTGLGAGGNAQTASLYAKNLVVNGGAEADVGAPDSTKIVKPSSWTTTGQFTAVQYGASGGFPDKSSPGPADRGKNLFEGGNVPKSTASQTISLKPVATDIAAGTVRYVFSAWLGGFASQGDNAKATLSFRAGAGASLGQSQLGPVTPAERKSVTGLVQRSTSGDVPKSAASATITIELTRTDGLYNDGAIDNVALVLSNK
jgi:hypothetical protein